MDVCCFNRPYDDETQDRIRLEAEAIRTILSYCERGIWKLIGSYAIDLEISKTPNTDKKQKVSTFLAAITEKVKSDSSVDKRVTDLTNFSFRTLDALHIALAEKAGVDVFLTTDDRLLKKAMKENSIVNVPVANPLKWLIDRGEW